MNTPTSQATTDVPVMLSNALAEHYHVERVLGQGGMATVYLARDLRHDRTVAVKVLRPELIASVGVDRFLTEIRTTSQLKHPHILPLFDSGSSGSILFYAMPFIEGESLRARIQRLGRLALDEIIRMLQQLADALAYAHGHGIIHRDVKPENVLVSGSPPFAGSPQEIATARLTRAPEAVTRHRSDTPPALAAVVMRCLEGNRDRRYQRMEDVLAALESLGTSETAKASGSAASIGARALVVVALVAVIAAAAIWYSMRVATTPGGLTIGRITRITSEPGLELDPAIAPDGRTVAYVAGPTGKMRIYIDGGTPRLLVRFDDPSRRSLRREFATDGNRFYFTIAHDESDIWALELLRK